MREMEGSCSECGVLLSPTERLYSERGDLICQACTTKKEITASNERAAKNAEALAYGNALVGIGSIFFDPFFLISSGAIGNCIYTFRRIRSEQKRGELVRHAKRQKIAAVIGAVIALLTMSSRLHGCVERWSGEKGPNRSLDRTEVGR